MTGLQRWYKNGTALLDEIGASETAPGSALIWFMGQHGFVLNVNNIIIYIDVILNALPGGDGKDRRRYPPPFDPDSVQPPDYFFCTHNHSDHLNLKTLLPLAEANPKVRFVVPMPHRHILTGAGIAESRVLGAREGEELSLPSSRDSGAFLSLSPLAAAHPDYAKAESGDYPSLGYVIRGGGVSVYHSGDTYVNPRLVEGLKKMLPLDIAVLPINGGDWERTSQNIIGNMSALDAVKLARTIGTDLVIPAHYDMMPNNSENPGLFAEYMYTLCPEKRFHIFALGEKYRYEKARESTDLFNRE